MSFSCDTPSRTLPSRMFSLLYLYPNEIFKVSDPHELEDWIQEIGEDGERYAYPAPLNSAGFFEDFFDGKPEAVGALWHAVNQRLPMAG